MMRPAFLLTKMVEDKTRQDKKALRLALGLELGFRVHSRLGLVLGLKLGFRVRTSFRV